MFYLEKDGVNYSFIIFQLTTNFRRCQTPNAKVAVKSDAHI